VRVLVPDDKDFSLTAIRNQGRPSSKQETPDYSIFCETTPTKNIKGGDISKVKSGKHNQRWFPPFLSKPARTSFRIEIAVINH
jgi:hypothetical protein